MLSNNNEAPQPYRERFIPLSGWDVGYAISFDEANKAVKHYQGDLLKEFTCESKAADRDLEIGIMVTAKAHYKNWQLIGSTSGNSMGMLVQLFDLKVTLQKLELDENGDIEIDGDKYAKVHDPKDHIFTRPVGAKLEMSLKWYESHSEKDLKHALKVTNNKDEIEAKRDFIRHPKDIFTYQKTDHTVAVEFDINSNSMSANAARTAIGEVLVNDALSEFDYVFATIDYTSTASEKVSWLTLTNHTHSVTVSSKKPEDILPDDATEEEKYNYYMQVKGYNPATLMILGMIENRKAPENIPNILNVVPKGCDAGYAYNDELIIKHLIYGHLNWCR